MALTRHPTASLGSQRNPRSILRGNRVQCLISRAERIPGRDPERRDPPQIERSPLKDRNNRAETTTTPGLGFPHQRRPGGIVLHRRSGVSRPGLKSNPGRRFIAGSPRLWPILRGVQSPGPPIIAALSGRPGRSQRAAPNPLDGIGASPVGTRAAPPRRYTSRSNYAASPRSLPKRLRAPHPRTSASFVHRVIVLTNETIRRLLIATHRTTSYPNGTNGRHESPE